MLGAPAVPGYSGPMRAISLIQPWASLVVLGHKRYETRSWQTSHRGPLLIHASKKLPDSAKALVGLEPFRSCLASALPLPVGCILGAVHLIECQRAEELDGLTDQERAFGDFRLGRWARQLARPNPLVVPIPFRGCLGFFDVPESLLPEELCHVLALENEAK
jgi:hypothetical protein